ncbi:MAG: hypothetical protein NTW87_17675 [Planctomycetota bacterium]|nr:hypothetical protein [Planctomycetota bacterium]
MNRLTAVVFALLVSLVAGCGGMTQGTSAAAAAIVHIHEQMNQGQFEEIWNESDAKLRAATPKEKYLEFMNAVKKKLGKVVSSQNAGWRVNNINATTSVIMTEKAKFEQGEGTEVFTFVMDGEKAVLVGYNIQSRDLVVK